MHVSKSKPAVEPVKSVANHFSTSPSSTNQFVNNRPETASQFGLQKMADASPRVGQLQVLQKMANSKQVVQRVTMLYDHQTGEQTDGETWDLDKLEDWDRWFNNMGSIKNMYQEDRDKWFQLYNSQPILDAKAQRTDPIKFQFDQSKIGFTRNPLLVKAAEDLIDQFETTNHPKPFLFYNKSTVVKELREVVTDPSKMHQKNYPICGVDTYLRMYAVQHPDAYVKFAIDLLDTGTGHMGNQTVTVPKTVREKKLAVSKMRISEWVPEASLRIRSNTPGYNTIRSITPGSYNFVKKWNSGIAGGTSLKEVKKWFTTAGIPANDLTMEEYLVMKTPKTIINTINQAFGQGKAIALIINASIVGNTYNHSIGKAILFRHLVLLSSNIQLINNNYMAEVMTWGDTKKIVFKESQLSRSILGYLAADLTNLPKPILSEDKSEDSGSEDD